MILRTVAAQLLHGSLKEPSVLHNKSLSSVIFYHKKKYPENFRWIHKEMTEKSKKKNPQKAKTFVWEPIEGYNVEPRFLTGTVSKPKKVKIKRGTKSMSIQI
jgi:hypothetical protein